MTPRQVKGNTQGSPGWVRHPPAVGGEVAEAAEGEGEAGFWQEFFFTFLQEGKPLRSLASQQDFSPDRHLSQGRLNNKFTKVGLRLR